MNDKNSANQALLEKLERGLDAKRKSSDCEDKLSLTDEERKKNSEKFRKQKNKAAKVRKKAKKHLEQFTPLDDDTEFDACNHNNEDKAIETTGVVKDEDFSAKKTVLYRAVSCRNTDIRRSRQRSGREIFRLCKADYTNRDLSIKH